MWRVIFSTYKKNRIGIIRAVPWSFMVSRIVTGITQIVFPYFIYYYFMNGNMNKEFGAYAEGADYMTYELFHLNIPIRLYSQLFPLFLI